MGNRHGSGRWRSLPRHMLIALLALVAALGTGTAAPSPAAAAPQTITYEVRGKGNTTSLEDFAARAAQTYADRRGWNLGGSIRFVRVASGGQFTLWLSSPRYLPSFAAGCSTLYSCRVGRNVIINEAPFRGATTAWRATGASLRDYQHMVVNHETGHWLGFGHSYCPAAGRSAPVMQQQSKSMQGCRPNAWPTATERARLSRWRGVPIVPPVPPVPPEHARALVTQGYVDVLERSADPGGLQTWSSALSAGMLSRYDFMTALILSQEGAQRTVTGMYRDILNRAPDSGGLAGWSAAIAARRLGVVNARIALWTSRERLALSGGVDQWIADLYGVELGRPADPRGLARWKQAASALGFDAVAAGILGSTEWRRRAVNSLYQQMLHRNADAGGLEHWSDVLRRSDLPVVQARLGASSEYLSRAISG